MYSRRTIFLALLISLLSAGNAEAQDSLSLTKRNAIYFGPLDAWNRTISITYARKLKNGKEITFNPRVRFAKARSSENSDGMFQFVDPKWYYNKYQARAGFIFRQGRLFCFEPQLELSYGDYYSKDLGGLRIDRQSVGAEILTIASWIKDYKYVRVRTFVGNGYRIQRIWERRLGSVGETHNDFEKYPTPDRLAFYYAQLTLHVGVDIGPRW